MTSRVLAIAGTVLAAVASLTLGGEPAGPILRATAGGAMQLESSHDGVAVLTASRLRPGDAADGTLSLSNRATGPQRLTLSVSDLVDTPGPGGGELSRWVELRIERGADEVYAGTLADLPSLDLGDLAAGSTSSFRFTVTLPEQGPAVDDAYAGGTVEVRWSWRGDADGDPPAGTPDPPADGAAPPAAPVTPPPADVAPSGRGPA
ncbi:MAG TPA: hypothetical protein VHF89_05595, partial [Solirubrobacteraceae bacterium]|nr:hypothetical protein [Solirubrobacteraceae bacterium]